MTRLLQRFFGKSPKETAVGWSNNPHAFALGPVFGPDVAADHPAAAVWRQFRASARIGDGCSLGTMAWCNGTPEQIVIGSRVICRGILLCDSGEGAIRVGDLVYVGDDVIISTRAQIEIGARTLIGHGTQIMDNDAHPIDARERHADFLNMLAGKPRSKSIGSAPVIIGEDCWLGINSIVLKGVQIGPRTIVAAGSVVTETVGADCVVAGNPARVVKSLV
jgi:acetyltransferase-like isoleucine patch superfamily enzyme